MWAVSVRQVCNDCMDDELGTLLPADQKPCSLFRGTCSGSVEKRIRGIIPPNSDIIGHSSTGGLRYCAPASIFTTSTHYYSEEAILQAGQSCMDDVPRWTNWDWSRMRDHPDTVKDELGLACRDHDNEATCPRSRRCWDGDLCHTDEPDWSKDEILQRGSPLGWGAETNPYIDPSAHLEYAILPPGYTYHLEATDWAVMPRPDEDALAT